MLLVSACLAGFRCRYDGKIVSDESVVELVRAGEAVPVCPEQMGGLPCPRSACERTSSGRVNDSEGIDRTESFEKGAYETLRIAKTYGCNRAMLKAKSPSCGKGLIHDGSFSGALIQGVGVTAELLEQNGIVVEVRE